MTARNKARLFTAIITIALAGFGSFFGLVASMWGGAFVIVPICTVIFGAVGALIGGAVETEVINRNAE